MVTTEQARRIDDGRDPNSVPKSAREQAIIQRNAAARAPVRQLPQAPVQAPPTQQQQTNVLLTRIQSTPVGSPAPYAVQVPNGGVYYFSSPATAQAFVRSIGTQNGPTVYQVGKTNFGDKTAYNSYETSQVESTIVNNPNNPAGEQYSLSLGGSNVYFNSASQANSAAQQYVSGQGVNTYSVGNQTFGNSAAATSFLNSSAGKQYLQSSAGQTWLRSQFSGIPSGRVVASGWTVDSSGNIDASIGPAGAQGQNPVKYEQEIHGKPRIEIIDTTQTTIPLGAAAGRENINPYTYTTQYTYNSSSIAAGRENIGNPPRQPTGITQINKPTLVNPTLISDLLKYTTPIYNGVANTVGEGLYNLPYTLGQEVGSLASGKGFLTQEQINYYTNPNTPITGALGTYSGSQVGQFATPLIASLIIPVAGEDVASTLIAKNATGILYSIRSGYTASNIIKGGLLYTGINNAFGLVLGSIPNPTSEAQTLIGGELFTGAFIPIGATVAKAVGTGLFARFVAQPLTSGFFNTGISVAEGNTTPTELGEAFAIGAGFSILGEGVVDPIRAGIGKAIHIYAGTPNLSEGLGKYGNPVKIYTTDESILPNGQKLSIVADTSYDTTTVNKLQEQLVGKVATNIHATYDDFFNVKEGTNITLKGFPEGKTGGGNPAFAQGVRVNNDILGLFTAPTVSTESSAFAYGGYIGIGDAEEGGAVKPVYGGKPRLLIFQNMISDFTRSPSESNADFIRRVNSTQGLTGLSPLDILTGNDRVVERQTYTSTQYQGEIGNYEGTQLKIGQKLKTVIVKETPDSVANIPIIRDILSKYHFIGGRFATVITPSEQTPTALGERPESMIHSRYEYFYQNPTSWEDFAKSSRSYIESVTTPSLEVEAPPSSSRTSEISEPIISSFNLDSIGYKSNKSSSSISSGSSLFSKFYSPSSSSGGKYIKPYIISSQTKYQSRKSSGTKPSAKSKSISLSDSLSKNKISGKSLGLSYSNSAFIVSSYGSSPSKSKHGGSPSSYPYGYLKDNTIKPKPNPNFFKKFGYFEKQYLIGGNILSPTLNGIGVKTGKNGNIKVNAQGIFNSINKGVRKNKRRA